VALPFTLKSILRQKEEEEELWKHLTISPCKNIIFKENALKEKPKKILQDIYIITL
jgi:hypothetical protein